VLRKGVFWQPTGKEMVLFTEDGDSVFTVNESGTLILQALVNGTPSNRIAQQLSKQYGDSVEICEGVVNQFVDRLKQEGLCDPTETTADLATRKEGGGECQGTAKAQSGET